MLVLGLWSRIKNSFNNFTPNCCLVVLSVLVYKLITLRIQSILPLGIAFWAGKISVHFEFLSFPRNSITEPREPSFRSKKWWMWALVGSVQAFTQIIISWSLNMHTQNTQSIESIPCLKRLQFGDLVCYLPPPKKKNTPWHLQHLYPCAAVHLVPLPWHHFKQSNIQGYIGPEMNFNSWLFREWIQPHFGIDKYNRFLFGKYLNWNCQGPGVFSLIQEISSRLVHININLYIITSSCPLHSSSLSLPGYPLGYPKLSNWKSGYSANLKRILSCRLLKPRVILKVVWGQSTPENQWKPPWCSVLRSGIV